MWLKVEKYIEVSSEEKQKEILDTLKKNDSTSSDNEAWVLIGRYWRLIEGEGNINTLESFARLLKDKNILKSLK